jgi:MFS family permease
VFWWQFAGTLVNRLGWFVEPFLVLYLTTQRGLPVAAAGGVLAVYGAGSIVSQPVGGWLADRVGRRISLIASLLAASGSVTLLGLARPLPLVIPAAALAGLCASLYRPASQALVADVVAPADRPRAYALLFWAVNLGYAVSTSAAGLLAQRGWWLLFAVDAATTAAFALLLVRPTRGLPHPVVPVLDGQRAGRTSDALHDRLLLAITALTLAYATVYLQAVATLPLAIHDAHQPTTAYGLIMALNGIVIVIVQPPTLPLLARWPRDRLLAGSMTLVGIGFGLTAFCRTPWQFATALLVWTIGEIGTAGTLTSIVADIAPVELRGRYLGVAGLSWGIAALIAPLLGTAIYAHPGPGWLWAGCTLVGAACGGGQLALGSAITRRQVELIRLRGHSDLQH